LLQAGKDGRQITTSADVCNEMGSSCEEQDEQAAATARRSERVGGDRVSGGGATV